MNNSNGGSMNGGMNGGGVMNDGIIGGVENAVDDIGNAVGDLIGGNNSSHMNGGNTNAPHTGNNASGNTTGANATSFQQMISNARVHDTDGVLTDGENSHW